MSMLRNCSVVSHNRQIGLLQDIGLDMTQKKVQALIIAGGFRGKRVVSAEQILSMTADTIFVGETKKYRKEYEPERIRFVRNCKGLLIGKVTDYMLNEETKAIAAFQIMQGYTTRAQRVKAWVFSWLPDAARVDELIIPDAFSCELTDLKGEA